MSNAKQAKQSCECWTWSLALCGILGGAWCCHTVLNTRHFIPFVDVCAYGWRGNLEVHRKYKLQSWMPGRLLSHPE